MALQHGTPPVQERGVAYLEVTYLDKNQALSVPASIRYRIDDITYQRQTEILDWTAVTVTGTSSEIVITGTQNRILKNRNSRELRQVTVESTGTDGRVHPETFEYEVINRLGTT